MNTGKDCNFQLGFLLKQPCLNNLLFLQVLLNVHFKFHVSKIPFTTTSNTGNKTWWFIYIKDVTETFVIGVFFSMELFSMSDLSISPKIEIPSNPRNQPIFTD